MTKTESSWSKYFDHAFHVAIQGWHVARPPFKMSNNGIAVARLKWLQACVKLKDLEPGANGASRLTLPLYFLL